MSVLHRVVRADPLGAGWVVFDGGDLMVLTRTKTKQQAVEAATQELLCEHVGGRLEVYYADGRLESDRAIPPLQHLNVGMEISAASPKLSETAQVIAREGKHIDKGLNAIDFVVATLALLGAPIGALMNPSLQEAASGGWILFAFATFTWTAGCAAGVVTIMKSGLLGYPLLFAVSACYGGALAIATLIGYGELEITAQTSFGPFNFVASVVMSALAAYGPLGFFLSGGIGTWLGIRLSAHVPDNFLT